MVEYPVKYSVEYPEKLSRGILILRTLLGWIYVGVPHGVCLMLYGIACGVVLFISWWAVLFTGKFPKSLFDFLLGYFRWGARVGAYMSFMTDKYPPFTGKE
jgi:hypothetical protein